MKLGRGEEEGKGTENIYSGCMGEHELRIADGKGPNESVIEIWGNALGCEL